MQECIQAEVARTRVYPKVGVRAEAVLGGRWPSESYDDSGRRLNRHRVLHGQWLRYGRIEHVLRAILIVDFLGYVIEEYRERAAAEDLKIRSQKIPSSQSSTARILYHRSRHLRFSASAYHRKGLMLSCTMQVGGLRPNPTAENRWRAFGYQTPGAARWCEGRGSFERARPPK